MKRPVVIIIISFIFSLCLLQLNVLGQQNARIVNFTRKWAFMQDSQGYIWYGTEDGKVGRYLHGDPLSEADIFEELPGCFGLNFIEEDSEGFVWIGLGCGLYRFDPVKLKFEDVWASVYKQIKQRSVWAESWYEDKSGNVWFGGPNLYSYSFKTKKYSVILPDSISELRCNIFGGEGNTIWFTELNRTGTHFKQYDPAGNKFIKDIDFDRKKLKVRMSGVTASIKTIPVLKGNPENYLTFFGPSMTRFDASSGMFRLEEIDSVYGDINEISNHGDQILIGTQKGYVLQYDPVTAHTEVIWKNPGKESVDLIFPAKFGYSAFASTENSIYPIPINPPEFRPVFRQSDSLAMIRQVGEMTTLFGKVYMVYPDVLMPVNDQMKADSIHFNPTFLYSDAVDYSVAQAGEDKFWVVSRYYPYRRLNLPNFIQLRDRKGALIKSWLPGSLNDFLSTGIIYKIQPDSKDRLWIATNDGKIGFFDSTTDSLYLHADVSRREWLNDILIDKKDRIWMGSYNEGIVSYDPQKKLQTEYHHNPADSNTITSEKVESLFEASNGEIWIGSADKGISILDPADGKIRILNRKNGLPELNIPGIEQDKNGVIWVATTHYLCKWIEAENRFALFRQQDGFEFDASFEPKVFYPENSGKMYLRHKAGTEVFDVDSLQNYKAFVPP